MKHLMLVFTLLVSACGEITPEAPSATPTPSPEKPFALSYGWLGDTILARTPNHWLRITAKSSPQMLPEQPFNPEANILHWQAPLTAFSTYEGNQHHLRSLRLPDGAITDLGKISANNASPLMAWDPNGQRLAVAVLGLNPVSEGLPLVDASIYILSPGQAPQRIMTRTQAGVDTGDGSFAITQLRWRPDGQLLASSEHIAATTNSKLWRISPDGSEHQELLNLRGRTLRDFSLAPNGRLAMIVQARIDRQGIYLAEADGSDIQNVLAEDEHQEAINEIQWAPDQQALVYTSRPLTSGSYADILRLDLGDKQVRNLTNTPERQEQQLQWSPNGQLTYVIGQASPAQRPELGLYQMPPEGGRREALLQIENLSP